MPINNGNQKKRRPPIAPKIKANLQKEINSKCPFCQYDEVGQFEIHHIDEDPSNNEFENLLMLCPNCHSKITKKDISVEEVLQVKKLVMTSDNISHTILLSLEISQSDFKKNLISLFDDKKSLFYSELKEHWNSYTLIEAYPLMNLLINSKLGLFINNDILGSISDYTSRHIQNDREAKYLYNQKHIYPHNTEDEGFDLPLFYFIKFIGLLYSTSIIRKTDIGIISNDFGNMQTIYSHMMNLILSNWENSNTNYSENTSTNYEWMIAEIFHTQKHWMKSFCEEKNFNPNSTYIQFFPFSMSLCFNELYNSYISEKVSEKFVVLMLHHNVLSFYFSNHTNEHVICSLEKNVISNIPIELLSKVIKYSLNELYALPFKEFYDGKFLRMKGHELIKLERMRLFLFNNNLLH